jgi:HD-like signal output (HDOD) protein
MCALSMPRSQRGSALPGYGKGVVHLDASDHLDPDELVANAFARLRSPSYQPPLLPDMALQLLELSRRTDTTAKEIADLLERDAVLAANVLRVANGAAFRVGAPVRTLRDATVRLGIRTIAAILFDVWSRAKLFRAPGYEEPMALVRRHSAATAFMCRQVARYSVLEPDVAYLCGLMHDVGIALGLSMIAEGRAAGTLPSPFELCHVLRDAHVEMGTILCTLWKLPDVLVDAVRDHHRILQEPHPTYAAAVVVLAEAFANRAELALPADQGSPDEERRAAEVLGLGPGVLHKLEEEAARLGELID